LCRDYLALGDEEARRLGPPLFDQAARTLLRVSPHTSTALELMRHRLQVARGRAILECLVRAAEPWAYDALAHGARVPGVGQALGSAGRARDRPSNLIVPSGHPREKHGKCVIHVLSSSVLFCNRNQRRLARLRDARIWILRRLPHAHSFQLPMWNAPGRARISRRFASPLPRLRGGDRGAARR
jgi:hypothetical protein